MIDVFRLKDFRTRRCWSRQVVVTRIKAPVTFLIHEKGMKVYIFLLSVCVCVCVRFYDKRDLRLPVRISSYALPDQSSQGLSPTLTISLSRRKL